MRVAVPTSRPATGKPVELWRYEVPEGTRMLVGQRVDGIVRVEDRPLGAAGRSYLVERRVDSLRELAALTADYKRQAKRVGDCPMRSSVLALELLDEAAAR